MRTVFRVVVHTGIPNTGKAEAGESGVPSQVQPHREFEACFSSMRACLKKIK